MIQYYGIYPPHVNPNNLHEIEKIFLIYLAGNIPKREDWAINISYLKEKDKIENINKIKLEDSEIDLANIRGDSIEKLYKSRLEKHKEKLHLELDKKYGLVENDKLDVPKKAHEKIRHRIADLINKKPEQNE
jgi:hypothetical protein